MEDIPETYDLQSIEQLRAVADPLRIRIYEALTTKAMTATQVAEMLDELAPKTHYHVRELERVGLVRLVETRERGGILEKYYRAVAHGLRVPPSMLQQAPLDDVTEAMSDVLNSAAAGFKTAMLRMIARKDTDFTANAMALNHDSLWMTADEYQRALKTIAELLKPYFQRRGIEGEREIVQTIIGYEARLGRPEDTDQRAYPAPPSPPRPPTPPSPPRPPSSPPAPGGRARGADTSGGVRKVVVAGALNYSKRELQEIADRGERLDLTVIGYLSFANDVSVDLVRRVVQRLSYRGMLTAPADVREALKEKED